jgi:hypothetical protein
MWTGGAYLPLRHDRHLSEASSFQIGVLRGRLIASNCPNQLWIADITYGAPRPEESGERMFGMH